MATMADVARLAGVNPSTVSHVLNGTRNVSPQTRAAVQEAIERTGYRPNVLARSLATSSTTTVGFASRFTANPHFADLVRIIDSDVRAAGYHLVLADTHDEADRELQAITELLDRRVDGIVLAPSPGAAHGALPFLAGRGVPTVLLDRFVPGGFDQVGPENETATATLTEHLVASGHRRIAYLTGLPGISSTTERLAGHRSVLRAHGLHDDPALILAGGSEAGAAEEAVLLAFARSDPPSGLVAGNNAMTIGALRALRRLRLRVPDDVALVAFDDPEWADLLHPRLTTVSQNVELMAATAVTFLLARLAGTDAAPRVERIAPTFCHRTSCGCPN